jgi:very-short-patch-repair endonuclease
MVDFEDNLEDLLLESERGRKDHLVRFVRKNLKEGVHYISRPASRGEHGGHNKVDYLLTRDARELVTNTYNLKHKYVSHVGSLTQVRTIMSLENQTIGFIMTAFNGTEVMERQYAIGAYSVDLCFVQRKIVVECDEHGHNDYDQEEEAVRTNFLTHNGFKLIRFNPCEERFDLALVLKDIMMALRQMDVVHRAAS